MDMRHNRWQAVALTSYNINLVHYHNPLVTAWWAAAFPGFGHILLGNFIKGYVLMIWEFIVNIHANLNVGILYSFTGRYAEAQAVLDTRWLILYCPIYIYGIWNAYGLAIDLNKVAILVEKQPIPIDPMEITGVGLNMFDKRIPALAAIWSALTPGLGHLYTNRMTNGIVLLIAWVVSTYFSLLLPAIHATLLGDFAQAVQVVNPQWLLFLPSIYSFAIFDAYTHCVEYNKLFNQEQIQYLKNNYQYPEFTMPV